MTRGMHETMEAALGRLGLYDRAAYAYLRFRRPSAAEQRKRLLALHRPLIAPGDLVFDIGANRGRLTRIYLRLGASVVAVEPNPLLADLIGRRYPRATVQAVGVGSEPGEGSLILAVDDQHATLSNEWVEITRRRGLPQAWTDREVRVPVVTLDQLIAEHGAPDYVKIDTEGLEAQVLTGLSCAVPMVSFEFQVANRTVMEKCFRLLDALGSYRYRVTVRFDLRFQSDWTSTEDALSQIAEAEREQGIETFGDVFAQLDNGSSKGMS